MITNERTGEREQERERETGRERERGGERERERERSRSIDWMITNFNTNNINSDPPENSLSIPQNHLPVQHPPVNTIENIDTGTTTIATF